MTNNQWDAFCDYKDKLKKYCKSCLKKYSAELMILQKDSAKKDGVPDYTVETPVVYNKAYDSVSIDDEINLIVVGDNPGKKEQLKENNKYLVGNSGVIAENFFCANKDLKIDFRKNVIITNKTPVHTAKTKELKYLYEKGSQDIKILIEESQKFMANLTVDLHKNLIAYKQEDSKSPQLWLVGYSELKPRGIFSLYRDCLKSGYESEADWKEVFVYQHFSMNRFTIDLRDYRKEKAGDNLKESLKNLGYHHRNEIFGDFS